jgi:2-haloacid dehalogenase
VLQVPLCADVAEALPALRATGRRLALLTNASPIMAILQAKAGGVYTSFDAFLATEAAGAVKPQAAAYRLVAERFGVAPRQVLYVASQAWDVAGAAQAGLTAVWLNRAGAAPEYSWAPPAAAVASLQDLAALLPAPQAA